MSGISSINPSVSFKGNETKSENNSMLLFSPNPLIDAGITGGAVGIGAAALDCFQQNKKMKPENKDSAIANLEKDKAIYIKNGQTKEVAKTENALKCLKEGKFNFKSMGNAALIMGGLFTFIPTLAIDCLLAGGKAAYDKTQGKE